MRAAGVITVPTRTGAVTTVPALLAAFAVLAWAAGAALAAPDGVDWTVADTAAACGGCHLSSPPAQASPAISIDGLPERLVAGREYLLTIALEDSALVNAGFLLTIRSDGAAGELTAVDERVETAGHQARSTWHGSFPPDPGRASWSLRWRAPAAPTAAIRFDVWANAGNDDLSPLGDRLHHRVLSPKIDPSSP